MLSSLCSFSCKWDSLGLSKASVTSLHPRLLGERVPSPSGFSAWAQREGQVWGRLALPLSRAWPCDPRDCVQPVRLPCAWVAQAGTLEWGAMPPAGDPRGRACLSCVGRHILHHCATWEAPRKARSRLYLWFFHFLVTWSLEDHRTPLRLNSL